MADNLIQLQEDVETFIDPNGIAGSILAENHQNILKGVLNKVGKYVGSPYLATKNETSIVPGVMSWNGNAMNNTNVFEIQFASLTADLNDFGLILGTLTEGDLIRFKDSVGRSVFLEFVSYQKIFVASLEICKVNVKGRAENINYIYQDDERLICVIETYKQNSSGAVYDLEYDSPNLILKENGVEKNSINRSIQIQDGDGVPQFDVSDLVQIEGASFDSANKRISFNQAVEQIYYVDTIVGNDSTGQPNTPSNPYKSIDGVFSEFPHDQQLSNISIIIVMINESIYEINNTVPYINVEFRCNNQSTISLTNNTNSEFGTRLFHIANGSQTIRWFFNMPLGSFVDEKTTGSTRLDTDDLIVTFNIDTIIIKSDNGNSRFFGRRFLVQRLRNVSSRCSLGVLINDALELDFLDISDYTSNASVLSGETTNDPKLIKIHNFVNNTNQSLSQITRSGMGSVIEFGIISGNIRLSFANMFTLIFNETPSVSFFGTSGYDDLTIKGKIFNLTWLGGGADSTVNFEDFICQNWIGSFFVRNEDVSFVNCWVSPESNIIRKTGTGSVTFDNTVVRQKTVGVLIDTSQSTGINIFTGGLMTNASSLNNNVADVLDQLTQF